MTTSINDYRTGLKAGARSEFLAIGDVIPGHEEALRQTLAQATSDPHIQQAIKQIGTLHEARFVLLDGGKRLVFASSFDGAWDTYIDDFARTDIGRASTTPGSTCRATRASSAAPSTEAAAR